MCSGPDQLNPKTPVTSSSPKTATSTKDMSNLTTTPKTELSFSSLLELAADNDFEGFKQSILCLASAINEIGLWYGRQRASKQMVLEHRTPLMVAAMYGSVDVVTLILSLSEADVNLSCSPDKSTALHCAASSGSVKAVHIVKLLLLAGADCSLTDANGHRPSDVIIASPNFPELKYALEELLRSDGSVNLQNIKVSLGAEKSNPLFLSSSSAPERKDYSIDPLLPDINSSLYSTDEFRMFLFKVQPCSRAYSHDWTECPFVHPGENARRRDPSKCHYSCVPCPDFRKGQCRRGDSCEYAHGVFECWLHPAQYRTRPCKDGTSCSRRVCFFAHTSEELRPLYMSTGSAIPSSRSPSSAATVMDMTAALNLLPGSPSAVAGMLPSPFTPPLSPSGNALMHPSVLWPQPNIPTLHVPGSYLQTSRLRSSFNARDIGAELNMLLDSEVQQQQFLNDMSCFSQMHLNTSSPRFSSQVAASAVLSPSPKPVVPNQFLQQHHMIAPINASAYPPKNLQPYHVSSPGMMSPRGIEQQSMFSPGQSNLAQHEKQHTQLCSLSSWDLVSSGAGIIGSPVNSLSNWGSPNGKADWSINEDELAPVGRSVSFGHKGQETDLSWVQSLVKKSQPETKDTLVEPFSSATLLGEGSDLNSMEKYDHAVLGAWLEQMQLDHIIA